MIQSIGKWSGRHAGFEARDFINAIKEPRHICHVLWDEAEKKVGVAIDGAQSTNGLTLLGTLPPFYPEQLGDAAFLSAHNVRFPYVGGAMARGICSAQMVIALARAGMLCFFGSAGLSLERLQSEITTIKQALDPEGHTWGANLIHTPEEPELERAIVDLYIEHKVQRISASAFMKLSPAIVYFACKGLHRDGDGHIIRKHRVVAKISRLEVAEQFMQAAPLQLLTQLHNEGALSATEVELAQQIPLAEDITVESDSGGHTDGRPLGALLPAIALRRDEIQRQSKHNIRLGAAGGIGTPHSVAAAFALGAAYVVAGTVHQTCIESGVDQSVRDMLAQAGIADCGNCVCADMFEQGVQVQVLKKGTLLPLRANELYQLYKQYPSIDAIPDEIKNKIEQQYFKKTVDEIWQETQTFFAERNPKQLERAARDAHYRMALIFRWYLGNSSRWPLVGELSRQTDYQIWCGPCIGAFNQWIQQSPLAEQKHRTVEQVALNLLEGACCHWRAMQLRSFGAHIPPQQDYYQPKLLTV